MKQLIRIEVADRPAAPLVPAAQQYYLRENLKLRLLTARIALLARNDASFSADLAAVEAWIKQYFDTRAKPVQTLQATIRQLAASPMPGETPDLTRSLEALRVLRLGQDRACRDGEPRRCRRRAECPAGECASSSGFSSLPARRWPSRWRRASRPATRSSSRRRIASSCRSTCCSSSCSAVSSPATCCCGSSGARCALPEEVRLYRQRQHLERARAKQDAAIVALLEGRYGRARQFAEEALAIPQSSGLSALLGARAAIATREFAAAEALLSRADASVPSLAVPRLMLEAEMKLEQGQPLEALGILGMLRKEAGSHTAALRLELRALQGAGRYAEIPPLVDQLVKRKVYGVREGEFVRAAAHAQELAARVLDGEGLRAYWSKLSEAEQRNPKIARAAARSFIALGGDREAAELLAKKPRTGMEFGARRTLRRVPAGRRRAATRAGRALAREASRRRDASLRAGRVCASARSCGGKPRRTSRRALPSKTAGARASRWASSSRGSIATSTRTRSSRRR